MNKIAFQMRNQGVYTTESADLHLVTLNGERYRNIYGRRTESQAMCATPKNPSGFWSAIAKLTGAAIDGTPSHAIMVNADELYGYRPDELEAIYWHEFGHFVYGHLLLKNPEKQTNRDQLLAELEADAFAVARVGHRSVLRAMCRSKVRIVDNLRRLHPEESVPPYTVYKHRMAVLMRSAT